MEYQGNRKVSLLQGTKKECYITGAEWNLHKHHIYYGHGRRDISDLWGFWVWLRGDYHNQSEYGVHGRDGHLLDLQLKQDCQRKFEEYYSRDSFRRIVGKSYL